MWAGTMKGSHVNTEQTSSCCSGAAGLSSSGSGPSRYLPTWLRGMRGIVLGVGAVAVGGAVFGWWPWLVAIGVAPILLSLLPCAVMCAFGLCMMRMGNGSKSAGSHGTMTDAAASTVAPLLLGTTSEPVLSPQMAPEREHAMLL